MINLIPNDHKTSYVYAKRNVILKKWISLFLMAIIGLGLLGTYGLVTIKQSTADYKNKISANNKYFHDEDFDATSKQVKDMSNNIKLSVKVLQQELLFSKLIKQIGAALPAGSVLNSLEISQTTGGIDLSVSSIDYKTATQVQVNLSDPKNKIFTKADIQNITCNATNDDGTPKIGGYPCTVSIRALFGPNNPYLFTNNDPGN